MRLDGFMETEGCEILALEITRRNIDDGPGGRGCCGKDAIVIVAMAGHGQFNCMAT